MSRTRTATRWVITYDQGPHFRGLYTGQWLTRKAAIRAHLDDKGVPAIIAGIPCHQSPRSEKQRREGWCYWQSKGDRAVKATITWQEPAK